MPTPDIQNPHHLSDLDLKSAFTGHPFTVQGRFPTTYERPAFYHSFLRPPLRTLPLFATDVAVGGR